MVRKVKQHFVLFLLLLILLLLTVPGAFSQQSTTVDFLLRQDEVLWGDAGLLILNTAGLVGADTDLNGVLTAMREMGFSPKRTDTPISLGEYCHLIMQCFDMQGGLLYRLFPSPRYASRELGWRGIILYDPGAYRTLSGQEALIILGRTLAELENEP